jgi:hypothetical protein
MWSAATENSIDVKYRVHESNGESLQNEHANVRVH